MRPICRQALPNWVALRSPVHAEGSAGGCQRSAPTGGLAYGTPFQAYVPLAALSSVPRTTPYRVSRTSGSVPPEPPQAAVTTAASKAALQRRHRGKWTIFVSFGVFRNGLRLWNASHLRQGLTSEPIV